MKKFFLLLLLTASAILQTRAQVNSPRSGAPRTNSYQNLEKYWYYRYRLVNDFMKIGDEPGNSIPARNRHLAYNGKQGMLHYGDATIDLGNYMQVLAMEYLQLKNNNLSTARTEYEIQKAINAYVRLDSKAEDYMIDIDNSYPPNAGNNYASSYGKDPLNGFFIRDDVPWLDYVNNNYSHFNRPGLHTNPKHLVTVVGDPTRDEKGGSAFAQRYKGTNPKNGSLLDASWLDQAFNSDPTIPRYPTEESQDQLVELFKGLGLISKFAPVFKSSTDDHLFNLINYMPDNGYGWTIRNPLTGDCVYGIVPHKYNSFPFGACFDAGAKFLPNAVPAKRALTLLTNRNVTYSQSSEDIFFQAMQHMDGKDQNFAVQLVPFSNNWFRPLIPSNNSFSRIVAISKANKFQYPHLPLLYKLLWPSNDNNKIGYCSGCGTDGCYDRPDYTELLDIAPPCGPYNHIWVNLDHAPTEWSSSDRLIEPQARHGLCQQVAKPNSADFVGLDYMILFNLYSLVQKDYLKTYVNPYYCENFDKTYPEIIGGNRPMGIGAHGLELYLNFLEYASLKNKLQYNASVIFRGGKKIDLVPGFETQYGASALVHIEDYTCAGETRTQPYHFAHTKLPTGYIPFMIIGDSTVIDSAELEIIEYGNEYIPKVDEETFETDTTLYPEDEQIWLDSLYNEVIASEDSNLIRIWQYYFNNNDTSGEGTSGSLRGTNRNVSSTANSQKLHSFRKASVSPNNIIETPNGWISIYPNPTSGIINVRFNRPEDYEVRVLNALGVVVYQHQLKGKNELTINLDGKLPPGNYVVQILTNDNRYSSRISLVR